jgi:hypothetical protein
MNKLSLFFCQYEEDDFHADRGINCNREILRTTVCSTCVFDESPTEKNIFINKIKKCLLSTNHFAVLYSFAKIIISNELQYWT